MRKDIVSVIIIFIGRVAAPLHSSHISFGKSILLYNTESVDETKSQQHSTGTGPLLLLCRDFDINSRRRLDESGANHQRFSLLDNESPLTEVDTAKDGLYCYYDNNN